MLHMFQTLPGMLTVIVACVAGAIGALAARAVGIRLLGYMVLAAAAAFLLVMVLMSLWGRRSFTRLSPGLETRFPSPLSKASPG